MGAIGIEILSGILIFVTVKTIIAIHKYFKQEPEVKDDELLTEEDTKSFFKISPEIEMDEENIKTQNHLRAMKYKLKMFKIRNEFYE